MSKELPVQKFQIGQRVQHSEAKPFTITTVWVSCLRIRYSAAGRDWYDGHELTLAPERSPYVPSDRSVFVKEYGQEEERIVDNIAFRCETDAEMDIRHAIERAAHDAQG